jgi:hypothetical protein
MSIHLGKRYRIQRIPHVSVCRYGLYTNLKVHSGLVIGLNLPIIGDLSLWRYWVPAK